MAHGSQSPHRNAASLRLTGRLVPARRRARRAQCAGCHLCPGTPPPGTRTSGGPGQNLEGLRSFQPPFQGLLVPSFCTSMGSTLHRNEGDSIRRRRRFARSNSVRPARCWNCTTLPVDRRILMSDRRDKSSALFKPKAGRDEAWGVTGSLLVLASVSPSAGDWDQNGVANR